MNHTTLSTPTVISVGVGVVADSGSSVISPGGLMCAIRRAKDSVNQMLPPAPGDRATRRCWGRDSLDIGGQFAYAVSSNRRAHADGVCVDRCSGPSFERHDQRDSSVVLSPSVVAHGNKAAPAWLAYGIAKLALLEKAGAPPRKSVTDFDSEVEARTVMLAVWTDIRAKDGGQDAYLDLLLTIKQAGFLREYVVAALARPGWTISGKELASLRVADYLAWADDHVPNHNVPNMVEVESRTIPQNPRVFGDSLPPPESPSPERVPCGQSLSRLTQARQVWLREAELLVSAPLAAAARQQFLALVRWAAEHAVDYPNGVVWVSPKAYKISFFTGFCAVLLYA